MSQTNPSESLIIETISQLLKVLSPESSTIQSTLDSTNSNNNGSNTDNTGNNSNNGNNGSVNNNTNGDNTGNAGNNGNNNNNTGNNNNGSSSGNDNNNNNDCQIQDLCERIWALLAKKKSSTTESNHGGQENSNKSSGRSSNSREKLSKNLNQIKDAWIKLREIEEGDLGKQIQIQLDSLKKILNKNPAYTVSSSTPETEFNNISKEINKLKHKIPSLKKPPSVGSGANQISQLSNGSNPRCAVSGLFKNPHENESFKNSSFYKEIEEIYKGLTGDEKKFFLSCFALFPENEVVKRRLLIYWWIGEGIVGASGTGENPPTPEKIVDGYLTEFRDKGLIEPANKDPKKSTKSYKMHPLVRSALILLTKDAWLFYFDYDSEGKLTGTVSKNSRACLEKAEEAPSKQVSENNTIPQQESHNLDQEKLKTLFNVDEPYPDLKLGQLSKTKDLSVVELLLKMRRMNVLYLGRWQKSAEYHIEVDNTEFLKGLRSMKDLKLLSLQGISRINELPSSIGNLSNLMILDLKACHNLELLPDEISSLKKLRYMDVSYCYLLDHMPRGLSSLSELQVLKGFVVGSTQSGKKGTLDDLKGLKKLRKLSINNSSKGFPTSKDLEALRQLGEEGALRKLSIAWGALQNDELSKKPETNKCCPKLPWGGGLKQVNKRRGSIKNNPVDSKSPATTASFKKPERQATIVKPKFPVDSKSPATTASFKKTERQATLPAEPKLPVELEKLDLHCFPEPTPPSWLDLDNLKSLKKLYVRGGKLKTLGNHQPSEVDTLCLKFLSEFKMNWRQLQEKFPKLNYLEKVDCPKITFCPCDENGVWLKPKKN